MKSILSAARRQGFEITLHTDFRLEGRCGELSLQFQRGVHTPLSHSVDPVSTGVVHVAPKLRGAGSLPPSSAHATKRPSRTVHPRASFFMRGIFARSARGDARRSQAGEHARCRSARHGETSSPDRAPGRP